MKGRMMRKKLIAGNWKMNGLHDEGCELARAVSAQVKNNKLNCDFLVCPPFTLLSDVRKCLRGSGIALGAQDVHFAEKGAHTGDISPLMLKDAGCSYVIVGHSERRADHKENNSLVSKKADAAHKAGLKTIICVGETGAERDAGKTLEVCRKQVRASLPKDADSSNTTIAYEPVWAIGTGRTPTSADVEEVHAALREVIAGKLGKRNAANMKILYGGSVKPGNAAELLSLPDVDGALVGGASLKADDFINIAKNGCK